MAGQPCKAPGPAPKGLVSMQEQVIYESELAAMTMPNLSIRVLAGVGGAEPLVTLSGEGVVVTMEWTGFEYLVRGLEDVIDKVKP
jgi:hypothetical protein